MAADKRRIEPWPIALALALLVMIAGCLVLWQLAQRHRDAELLGPHDRPGLESRSEAGGARDGER